MRVFSINHAQVSESTEVPAQLPEAGFVWISCSRKEFADAVLPIQAHLQALCGVSLVDLHVSDLLNAQLPSHYDFTSQYDVLVFRRLAASATAHNDSVLARLDTSPVGFAVFDRVLLSVHPDDCAVRNAFASKLLTMASSEVRSTGARLPSAPADLMLRVVNMMVDGYLDLRRELTHQLEHWQSQLLNPRARFSNWSALLEARQGLHLLDAVCEDQRAAIQNWIETLKSWPEPNGPAEQRERDLLNVRSRDVLEHIERVVHHVHRLEQSVETAVQMHYNAQSNRTNDIMRTLTVLTAIFLPLNLIAAIFGMNFEVIPLVHNARGFWWAMGAMLCIAAALALFFWRKRYLGSKAE